ncbi:RNA-directed DNA polymerase, eukaryota [Artemisia annua]|uniref:RNA-directed DNA polymerase, eukaryota n=1 Tax=Artemisia annua TaxID=35608 RepID=A0A2U1Q577_ARTAN|nr:RNA-directed DNA polymerase, eukaryota [Artemisia annua]
MVLDDECVVKRDLDNFVMGEVKDFSSINNLSVLLSNEGFQQVNLAYLGGLWVMIELASVKTKMRFMKYVGIASWFNQLCNAQPDFVSRERIVWIDIEGIPLHAWSRPTFTKSGSRWGEVIELEDDKEDCFARKRICIKTNHEDNILEKFKIIVRGKVFVLRAKELFTWSPTFIVNKDVEYCSEDESVKGAEENNVDTSKQVNMDDDSDVDGVSETYFGDQVDSSGHDQPQNLSPKEKEISSDPFNLYDLLNKHGKDEAKSGLDSSIPFPPGFTPDNKEVQEAQDRGVDLISHCHIRVGNGLCTQFWNEVWIGDTPLRVLFPRIYALEINKDCSVADKLQYSVTSSLRRTVRGGVEAFQLDLLQKTIESTMLSNMEDRWVWDLNGDGVFRVKDVRTLLDECFLPKAPTATRWVKYVPIKINVFAWKVFLDRLPTRSNLQHRGIHVSDSLCPICSSVQEDSSHLFFSCSLVTDVIRLVCRWWNLSWSPHGSYSDWLIWFNSIRLSSKVKGLLEGVFYVSWWSVWMFRNQLLFSTQVPRKDVIFDDIVSRSFTWCHSRSTIGPVNLIAVTKDGSLEKFDALRTTENRRRRRTYKRVSTRNWSFLLPILRYWRSQEGTPSKRELGESSASLPKRLPVTGEPIHHTIPLMAARIARHEDRLDDIVTIMNGLPCGHITQDVNNLIIGQMAMEGRIEQMKTEFSESMEFIAALCSASTAMGDVLASFDHELEKISAQNFSLRRAIREFYAREWARDQTIETLTTKITELQRRMDEVSGKP